MRSGMMTIRAYHVLRAHGHWSRVDSLRYALWLAGWDWSDVAGLAAAVVGVGMLAIEYWRLL